MEIVPLDLMQDTDVIMKFLYFFNGNTMVTGDYASTSSIQLNFFIYWSNTYYNSVQ